MDDRLHYVVREGHYFGRRCWIVQTVEGKLVDSLDTKRQAERRCKALNDAEEAVQRGRPIQSTPIKDEAGRVVGYALEDQP